MRKFFAILLFLSISLDISAEIQRVTIKWNAALCFATCERDLTIAFRNVPAIQGFKIDPQAGVAEVKWNPSVPFNFPAFSAISRATGMRFKEIRVQASGQIKQEGQNMYLISRGDGTHFLLMNPLEGEPGRCLVGSNLNQNTSSELTQRLLQAQASHQLVTVEGALYEINQGALIIITESVSAEE